MIHEDYIKKQGLKRLAFGTSKARMVWSFIHSLMTNHQDLFDRALKLHLDIKKAAQNDPMLAGTSVLVELIVMDLGGHIEK